MINIWQNKKKLLKVTEVADELWKEAETWKKRKVQDEFSIFMAFRWIKKLHLSG